MARQRQPPSQTRRTFLQNHVTSMVSVDFFTVPTIRYQILYVFLVLAHDRRRLLGFGVTAHPTAERLNRFLMVPAGDRHGVFEPQTISI